MVISCFKPHQPITREQLAVMVYNYAKYAKLPLNKDRTAAFADQKVIANWAMDAVRIKPGRDYA